MSVASRITRVLETNLPRIKTAFNEVAKAVSDPVNVATFHEAHDIIQNTLANIKKGVGETSGGAPVKPRRILEKLADYTPIINDSCERIWDILENAGYTMTSTREVFLRKETSAKLSTLSQIIHEAIDQLTQASGRLSRPTVISVLRNIYEVLRSSFPFIGPVPKEDALPGAVSRGLTLLYPNALLTLLDSTAVSITDIISLIVISDELLSRFKNQDNEDSLTAMVIERALSYINNIRRRLSLAWGSALEAIDMAALVLPDSLSDMRRFSLTSSENSDYRGVIQAILGTTQNVEEVMVIIDKILQRIGKEYKDIADDIKDRDDLMQLLTEVVSSVGDDPKKRKQLLELINLLDPILINDDNFTKILNQLKERAAKVPDKKTQRGGLVRVTKLDTDPS